MIILILATAAFWAVLFGWLLSNDYTPPRNAERINPDWNGDRPY